MLTRYSSLGAFERVHMYFITQKYDWIRDRYITPLDLTLSFINFINVAFYRLDLMFLSKENLT